MLEGASRFMLPIRNHLFRALLILGFCAPLPSLSQQPNLGQPQTNSLQAEMQAAIHQVERIINQPVTAYRRAPGMKVGLFSPGWFHAGATKPNFNTVDIRATQETPYASHEYVTSDLNPGVVFLGRQLEFNSMTKYFYTNRVLPKKKLTEAEMQEINRLYRIIGRCQQQLARSQEREPTSSGASDTAETTPSSAKRPRLVNPYIGGGALVLLSIILIFSYSRRSR